MITVGALLDALSNFDRELPITTVDIEIPDIAYQESVNIDGKPIDHVCLNNLNRA